MHMKQLLAEKQVRSSDHNKGRKTQDVYSIIQNTEFAMAFYTVYSTYMWPLNTCMALSTVHLLQVSMRTSWGKLICESTPDSSAALL